jgi:RimJ/RimL family protein N-acetyltransferase
MVPVIETARLVLRGYEDSDTPELVRLIGAPEVAATTARIPHPYTEKDAQQFMAGTAASSEDRFAILRRSDLKLCGGIGLRHEPAHRHAELGYWIGVPYWGNGYATEASMAVLDYGFRELKLHRIVASHFTNNPASGKVLRKIGMRHEGCFREHLYKGNEFVDLEMYAVLRSEWVART